MTAHVLPLLVSQESSATGNTSDFNPELAQEKTSFAMELNKNDVLTLSSPVIPCGIILFICP
jgi:hypothetical protein